MPELTPREHADRTVLLAQIEASGLTHGEFARTVLGRDERTLRRWIAGASPIPVVTGTWLGALEITVKPTKVVVAVPR